MRVESFSEHSDDPRVAAERAIESDTSQAIAHGREVLRQEADALMRLARTLGPSFDEAVQAMSRCQGHVVVTGVGKSGHIGRKIAATLSSVGTPAFFMHAAEAMHGDLGQIREGDLVFVLSHSGESNEITRLLPHLKRRGNWLLAMTGHGRSALALRADCCLTLGALEEACPLGMAPTVSTTMMLALGDALALSAFRLRSSPARIYQERHPGGVLGRHMLRVSEVMRTGERLPMVSVDVTLREAIRVMTETSGRPGATLIKSADGTLAGLFTDGDLRRLLEREDFLIDRPLEQVMHRGAQTVSPETCIRDAILQMREHQIDQLVVSDAEGRPVGLLDVQDVLTQPV